MAQSGSFRCGPGAGSATGVVLTAAEGKRLLAEAVAGLPEVQAHLCEGMMVMRRPAAPILRERVSRMTRAR